MAMFRAIILPAWNSSSPADKGTNCLRRLVGRESGKSGGGGAESVRSEKSKRRLFFCHGAGVVETEGTMTDIGGVRFGGGEKVLVGRVGWMGVRLGGRVGREET